MSTYMPCKQPGSGTCSCCGGQGSGNLSQAACATNCLGGGTTCQIGNFQCPYSSNPCSSACGGTLASINRPGPKRDFRTSYVGVL